MSWHGLVYPDFDVVVHSVGDDDAAPAEGAGRGGEAQEGQGAEGPHGGEVMVEKHLENVLRCLHIVTVRSSLLSVLFSRAFG